MGLVGGSCWALYTLCSSHIHHRIKLGSSNLVTQEVLDSTLVVERDQPIVVSTNLSTFLFDRERENKRIKKDTTTHPQTLTNIMYQTTLDEAWMTPKKEGDTIPDDVTFKTRTRIESEDENPFDWKDVTTADLFKGKRVVLFALPGAFTPTCSTSHVPGYHGSYDVILGLGIDDVYCLSVNDAFVMRQWGLHLG